MTYKAYIDNIKAQTGKTPENFVALAKEKGFVKNGEVIKPNAWPATSPGLRNRTADSDTVTPTQSSCTSGTLNSQKRRYWKMQRKAKEVSN